MSLYKGDTLISGAIIDGANQSLSNLNSTGQGVLNAKANTDLSNLSVTGQAVINGKVSKSGDTMTGDLSITANDAKINFGNSQVTKGNSPSNDTWFGIYLNDSANDSTLWQSSRLGVIEELVSSSGTTTMAIGTYQNAADSTNASLLMLNMSAAGVASCSFPDTTCVDSSWHNYSTNFSFATATGDYTIDLSSHLPNDNQIYMVYLAYYFKGVSSPSWATISGSLFSEIRFGMAEIGQWVCNNFAVPVGTDRKLYYHIKNTIGSDNQLKMYGYRRIGTNS